MAYTYPDPALKELFRSGAPQKLTIRVLLKNGSTFTITEADVVSESFLIDRAGSSGQTLELGACMANELTFSLENNDGRFNNIDWAGATLIVNVGAGTGSIPMGRFVIDEAPKKRKSMSIAALDFMANFDRYVSSATLEDLWIGNPNIATLISRICNMCNVTLATNVASYPNASYQPSIPRNEQDLTYRQLLMYCVGIMGKCAYMDWEGRLRIEFPDRSLSNIALYPIDAESQTVNGVTFTNNKDGTITANGTATGGNAFIIYGGIPLEHEKYTLSGCPSGGGPSTYRISCNSGAITHATDYGGGVDFIPFGTTEAYIIIRIESGQTVSNLTFRPCIRREDSPLLAETITEAERYTSELEDYSIKVTGVMFVDANDDTTVYGTEDYAFDLSSNPFATAATVAGLSDLIGLSYTPFSASTLSMPHLFPYDCVKFKKDGASYYGILTGVTFKLNGATELVSTGESPTAHERAAVGGNTAGLIRKAKEVINERIVDALEIAKDNAANLIRNSGTGHIHYTYVNDLDGNPVAQEQYIIDGSDLEDSTNLWRWNLGGFAHSGDGGETYDVAITMDGHIVADFVDTGTLTANIIRTGVLQSSFGGSYWNLDTGVLHIERTDFDGNRIFTEQPTPPYYAGDVWVTNWLDTAVPGRAIVGDVVIGVAPKMFMCTQDRPQGSYNSADWQLISDYFSDGYRKMVSDRFKDVSFDIDTINGEITSKVSKEDYTGAIITSMINQSADAIKIMASHIDLDGAVFINGSINCNDNFLVDPAGNIKSNSGILGGWNIHDGYMDYTLGGTHIYLYGGVYIDGTSVAQIFEDQTSTYWETPLYTPVMSFSDTGRLTLDGDIVANDIYLYGSIKEPYDDITFSISGGIAAGTIGTRASQQSYASTKVVRHATIISISSTTSYIPIVSVSTTGKTVYCNYYRAVATAVTQANTTVKVRLYY